MDNTRLLNKAHNAMKRAANDHGVDGDPMLKWVRKADGLLRQCFAGVYLESSSDIAWIRQLDKTVGVDSQPSLYGFMAISAACRSALDVRVAINEGYCRKSKAAAYQDSAPSRVPSRLAEPLEFTMGECVQSIILRNPSLSRRSIIGKVRSIYGGALKGAWANSAGVKAAWSKLVAAGLADVVPTQPADGQAAAVVAGDEEFKLLEEEALEPEKKRRRAQLLAIPDNRRGGSWKLVAERVS